MENLEPEEIIVERNVKLDDDIAITETCIYFGDGIYGEPQIISTTERQTSNTNNPVQEREQEDNPQNQD